MRGRWRKLGLVFNAVGQADWMRSHAALPVAEPIGGNLFRVYFSPRDAENRSHIASLVLDLGQGGRVVDVTTSPVLSPGPLGAFDDSGVSMAWLTTWQGRNYLYYIGWNLGVTVPFRNSLGLCLADGSGHYRRYAAGPVMDRTMEEPYFVSAGCVLVDDGLWKNWYLSCTGWEKVGGGPKHFYHIKYAESDDGIHWRRDGVVAIDYGSPDEYAISRPCVVRDAGGWKMWYSYRGKRYRIGYAESDDGIHWRRLDAAAGIDTSTDGWDADMVEYPFVFDHRGGRYLLYNGNGYGESGFGLAVWEE